MTLSTEWFSIYFFCCVTVKTIYITNVDYEMQLRSLFPALFRRERPLLAGNARNTRSAAIKLSLCLSRRLATLVPEAFFYSFFRGKFCDANHFFYFFCWHKRLRAKKRSFLFSRLGASISASRRKFPNKKR